jgi:hypothetical protein
MTSLEIPEERPNGTVAILDLTPPVEAHLSLWEARLHEIPGYSGPDDEESASAHLPPAYSRTLNPPSYEQCSQSISKNETPRKSRPWVRNSALILVTADLAITLAVYIVSLTDLCRIGLFAFGSWVPLLYIVSCIFGRIGFMHVCSKGRVLSHETKSFASMHYVTGQVELDHDIPLHLLFPFNDGRCWARASVRDPVIK